MSFCGNMWVRMVFDDEGKDRTFILRCKRWSCPDCVKKNSSMLRSLLKEALGAYLESRDVSAPKLRYHQKLVSFTLPGAAFRSSHSLDDAEVIIKRNFSRFLAWMKKHRGIKDYVWVKEQQKDGFPHIHAIFLGPGVAEKDFLDDCRMLWEKRYGMGNVDVELVSDLAGSVHYLTKYLSKGLASGVKSFRVWSMSMHLKSLMKCTREKRRKGTVVSMGFVSDGKIGRVFKEFFGDCAEEWKALLDRINLKKLRQYGVTDDPLPF